MFELFHQNKCDIVVLVSGDTDFVPAIKACKKNFPEKKIICLFPYNRGFSVELKNVSDLNFKMGWKQYQRFILPDIISFKDGKTHEIPREWK